MLGGVFPSSLKWSGHCSGRTAITMGSNSQPCWKSLLASRINWDSAKQSKLLDRRLTSIGVRRKFETKGMGERAPSIIWWCVVCMCVMWSFSFLLPFFFFFKSLETNCAILHRYTKMLYIFFSLFFSILKKKSALHHHQLYYTYKMWYPYKKYPKDTILKIMYCQTSG